jgi:branched-chain amino acid aminotransferase
VIVSLNGRLVDHADAAIPIGDAGFLHADGVFETALLRNGGFLRLRQHLERLVASAAFMRLPAPDVDELDGVVRDVVRANGFQTASIRITLTRGAGAGPTLLVTARPPDDAWAERARHGWDLVTARTRRPSTAAAPAQLKALGRTYSLMARHEAREAGADDALLLTDAGHVCEGPSWNVFWRTGNVLFTPSLDAGVLAGVTRSILLEVAPAAGFEAREGLWARAALDKADEILATMTSVGVVSCRSLDGRKLPGNNPAADELSRLYERVVDRDTAADPL